MLSALGRRIEARAARCVRCGCLCGKWRDGLGEWTLWMKGLFGGGAGIRLAGLMLGR